MSKRLPIAITGKSVYYDDTLKALVIHTKNSAAFENTFTYEKDSDLGAGAWPFTVLINNVEYVLTQGFTNSLGVRLGDRIRFSGTLPTPLVAATDYYVVGLFGAYYWISATLTGIPIMTLTGSTDTSGDKRILTYGLLDLDAADGAFATGDWVEILSSIMELYNVRGNSEQGYLDSAVCFLTKSSTHQPPASIRHDYLTSIESSYDLTSATPEPAE